MNETKYIKLVVVGAAGAGKEKTERKNINIKY